jgi:hypothetical protein
MSKKELTDAMGEMKQQLRTLAACLGRQKILDDQTMFASILDQLASGSLREGTLRWNYSVQKIELNLDALHVNWPKSPASLVGIFDLKICGRIVDKDANVKVASAKGKERAKGVISELRKEWNAFAADGEDVCWIVDSLAADIQFLAHAAGNTKWEQFWHFDRHIQPETDTSANEPLEVHPLFHFHFGGDQLVTGRLSEAAAWGRLLELKSPRIAHPPLDLVLLIDFILANFAGRAWRNLTENVKEYHQVVEAAQQRFWCPYKRAVGDYFQTDHRFQKNHIARELWPSLACGTT